MFVLIVILVVPIGYLLATVWRLRHRDDPMREHEQAFATLRHMAESPKVQVHELAERVPIVSGHVRILSERPAGQPRPRRPPPARRARAGMQRRRTLTTSHPKIAVIPTPSRVTSSPDTTKDKTSCGRDIEVFAHASNISDLDRVAAEVEANAGTERTKNHNTVRVTLLRGEAESLGDEIAEKAATGPIGVGRSGDGSRSRRRTGGNDDALEAAIKRAANHADRMSDHPRSPMS